MPYGHFLECIGKNGWQETLVDSFERAIHAATMILFPRHRIHTSSEHKRCMLEFVKTAADFSWGCALLAITDSFVVTHPLCQVTKPEPWQGLRPEENH